MSIETREGKYSVVRTDFFFSGTLSLEELGKVAANFVEASQSGALESSLNVTLDAIVVTEPEPTPTTKPKATNESG